MKNDAEVVYDQSKVKLFFNENGTAKCSDEKNAGGLVAKCKGKSELSADQFDGLTTHESDAITGGEDIKEQIALAREGLSDAEESSLYGEILINPTKGLKSIRKAAKKMGYSFNKDELADALNEMDQSCAFTDVELDEASLEALLGTGGAVGQRHLSGC